MSSNAMKSKRREEELPDWLKSTHQQLKNGTKAGGGSRRNHDWTDGDRHRSYDPGALRAEAFILLGVKADDVELSPKIEHLFRGISDDAPSIKERIFSYLAGSDEDEAKELLALRKRLNNDQAATIPFEAYCVAAGLSTKKVFGLILCEIMDQEDKVKQVIVRTQHTKVVEATIEAALDVEFGAADRKMMHQAVNFLPVPKNSVTHVHGHQMIDNSVQNMSIAVLPPVEDMMKRLGDRFNERVLDLPAIAPYDPVPDDGDDDKEDDD